MERRSRSTESRVARRHVSRDVKCTRASAEDRAQRCGIKLAAELIQRRTGGAVRSAHPVHVCLLRLVERRERVVSGPHHRGFGQHTSTTQDDRTKQRAKHHTSH